jgi:hypothetical protein
MSSEFSFYQIDHRGESDPSKPEDVRTDTSTVIRREFDAKISRFGSNAVGARMASDYTRTDLAFKTKDELADHNVQTADTGMGANIAGRSVTVDHNPYVLGSTVKRVRDDQFFRMSMSNDRGANIDAPNFDVMDTNLVSANDLVAGKNWPSEGWRSFGGKYDFSEAYSGGGIH